MSHYTNFISELRLEPDDWLNYLRLDEDAYREILQKVTPRIKIIKYSYENSYHSTLTSQYYSMVFSSWKELCRFEVFSSDFSLSSERDP
jgi:hypothetical protein